MSLESLLAVEPPCTIMRQRTQGEANETGLPLNDLVMVRQSIGRLVRNSTRQVEAWRSLGIEATYEFITQDEDIENGQFLKSVDLRLFRVVGTKAKVYAKGNIPYHLKYPLSETSAT